MPAASRSGSDAALACGAGGTSRVARANFGTSTVGHGTVDRLWAGGSGTARYHRHRLFAGGSLDRAVPTVPSKFLAAGIQLRPSADPRHRRSPVSSRSAPVPRSLRRVDRRANDTQLARRGHGRSARLDAMPMLKIRSTLSTAAALFKEDPAEGLEDDYRPRRPRPIRCWNCVAPRRRNHRHSRWSQDRLHPHHSSRARVMTLRSSPCS